MSEHGWVWLGLAWSCLFVSCLMCLHGVSVCRNFDGFCFLPLPRTSFEQKEGLRYALLSSPSSDNVVCTLLDFTNLLALLGV